MVDDQFELNGLVFTTIFYVAHYLVNCCRVYRRADCQCDHAYSSGLHRNHIARCGGFRYWRVDCPTVLQTTGGFQIPSRQLSHVDNRRDCPGLSLTTDRLEMPGQLSSNDPGIGLPYASTWTQFDSPVAPRQFAGANGNFREKLLGCGY
jgi:hypothetical protein